MIKKKENQPLQTCALEALSKAAVTYESSPQLQTSYPSKARYLCKEVGHLFRNGSDTGISTWNNRLKRGRQILRSRPTLKSKGRKPLSTNALRALIKAAIAYQISPQVYASYSCKAQYLSKKVGHLFHNGSDTGLTTWNSRLHRARQIVRSISIPKRWHDPITIKCFGSAQQSCGYL